MVMEEDLVVKLESFGFTVNQAKVYLCIIQSRKTSVGKISKCTGLHRQDIYKLLPKLEKMGLISKTIDKPFMIEAIPIEKALETLILKEREKSNKRISHLENNFKEMINSIQKQPERKEETRFSLLTTDEAIRNSGSLAIKKIKNEYIMCIDLENIQSPSSHFRDFLQTVVRTKTKTRLLIINKEANEIARQTIDKLAPIDVEFTSKSIDKASCKNYQIIDSKEIWIATQQKTEAGHPSMLCTNDQNLISVYKENFKRSWTKAKTTMTAGLAVSSLAFISLSLIEMLA